MSIIKGYYIGMLIRCTIHLDALYIFSVIARNEAIAKTEIASFLAMTLLDIHLCQ
jgi:hypothetical protein